MAGFKGRKRIRGVHRGEIKRGFWCMGMVIVTFVLAFFLLTTCIVKARAKEKISILLGRIIYRSLAIIQSIQRAVNKEAPLLRNSLDEPFLENVCCNVGITNTIKYFQIFLSFFSPE